MGGGAGASGLAPSDPDTAQNQRVQIVFTASRSRCPPPAGELGLERLDLGQLLARGSRLPPSSTSAWITHRSTDSLPTPSCLATAHDAAINDGCSPTWSLTRRTARAFNSGSILLGMVLILPTQKDAASNLEALH